MAYCLPPELATKFKQGIASGDITPEKLANMDSESRRTFLEKYVGKDDAQEVNAVIESKLILKNQTQGLINGINKILGENTPAARDMVSRVTKMDKIINSGDKSLFMKDLVSKKLGEDVEYEEAKNISTLAKAVTGAKATGTETMAGVSPEYLQAKNTFNDYIDSLKPKSRLLSMAKDATTIGRNNLLMNISTPLKALTNQVANSMMEGVLRRLTTMTFSGASSDLASQANSEAWDTFNKTGNNVAGMENINDTHVMGKSQTIGAGNMKVKVGENFNNVAEQGASAAETALNKITNLSNKVAIDWEHVKPFTKAYQKTFYDSANIFSTYLAKGEGLTGDALKARADQIFTDSVKVEPTTEEGKAVRASSQQQGARVTSSNDTIVSGVSLAIKNGLNATGIPLGDLLEPIAKIPATSWANAMENAGFGFVTGAKDLYDGMMGLRSEFAADKINGMMKLQSGIQTLARTTGSIALGLALKNMFKKTDFRQDAYGSSYVKFGNTWVNLEWVGALNPTLAGALSTYGSKNPLDAIDKYTAGSFKGFQNVPGVGEIYQFGQSMSQGTKGAIKYGDTLIQQRDLPAFINNAFNTRPVNRLFFGATGLETTQDVKADNEAKAKKAAASRRANNK